MRFQVSRWTCNRVSSAGARSSEAKARLAFNLALRREGPTQTGGGRNTFAELHKFHLSPWSL